MCFYIILSLIQYHSSVIPGYGTHTVIAILVHVIYSCFYNQTSDINILLSLIYSKFQAATAPNNFLLSNEASCYILKDYADQTPLSIQSNNNGGECSPSIGQLNFFNNNF